MKSEGAHMKQLAIIKKGHYYISAVLEDQRLDNVIVEDIGEDSLQAGDIYVCRVSHILQNINAAFVEVQKNVMCYLPIEKKKGTSENIVQGMEFAVQVRKAAVKSKQAVVSRKLEFAGKFAVVTTDNLSQSISSKISEPTERQRLDGILEELQTECQEAGVGIILRTSCSRADREQILSECRQLIREAQDVLQKAGNRIYTTRLYRSQPEFIKFLDSEAEPFSRIITDVPEVFRRLESYPGLEPGRLQFYEDSSYSLDKLLGISSKLAKAQKKHVWLKSGGSLVIEPTEALTVIDVNTQKAVAGKRNSETTFFNLNMEAAREAARQIRIRNISGIILIDFIDMKEKSNIQALLQELESAFLKDHVKTTVVDITRLGLVEITRMKVRKPLSAFCIKDFHE